MQPVAIVTEIISPYRIPVLNELSRLLDDRLEVFFINESEGRRDWPIYRDEIRFHYQVLGGVQLTVPLRGDFQPFYLAPPLLLHLARRGFRVLLGTCLLQAVAAALCLVVGDAASPGTPNASAG